MTFPTRVTFHGVDATPEIEAAIAGRIRKIERLCDQIVHCRVVIEAPLTVHVSICVPRVLLTVTKKASERSLESTVRRAFDSAERSIRERPLQKPVR